MLKAKGLRKVIASVLFVLLLTACGTLEVGFEPNAGPTPLLQEEAPESSSTPVSATRAAASATPPATPTDQPVGQAGATQTAEIGGDEDQLAETRSSMWTEYRNERYGYGLALPCYWVTYPGEISPNTSSYDELFAMAHSVRGQWVDGLPPDRAIKLDIFPFSYADFGIAAGTSPAEAIPQILDDTIAALEPVTIGRQDGILVRLDVTGESEIIPEELFFFPLEPDTLLLFSAYPRDALATADVQGILSSLALSPEEPVEIPVLDPSGPVDGRTMHIDQEGGYCFQYPAEYALESFSPSQPGNLGEVLNLKLERPLYTTGLSVDVRRVGSGQTLDELVTSFVDGFASDPNVVIERNPPEQLGGLAFQVGGQPAEWLEGVPGPLGAGGPVTRDIFVLYEGRLYHLSFSPSPQNNPQAGDDVQLLFQSVIGSFSFGELPFD